MYKYYKDLYDPDDNHAVLCNQYQVDEAKKKHKKNLAQKKKGGVKKHLVRRRQ